jgi:hypothetical protein
MKQNHTDITIILDRSGSMASVAEDTIGGFNRFLKDQKAAPGTACITLHQFDDRHDTIMSEKNVHDAPDLTPETFVPRGWTALLDAIGKGVVDTGERMKKAGDAVAQHVVFVIITDGMENASKEYTHQKVNEMITHQRDKYKWEFVFLGANQDAIQVGGSIGVGAANSMTYAANAVGTAQAFASTGKNLRSMRAGGQSTMAYSQDDRDEQKKAGA